MKNVSSDAVFAGMSAFGAKRTQGAIGGMAAFDAKRTFQPPV